jgi:hypothetical protein
MHFTKAASRPTHTTASFGRGFDARAIARRVIASPAILAGIACVFWVMRYALSFGLHLNAPPDWAHAYDQTQYVASARAFAVGNIAAAKHWYPLLYPIVAAPFVRLLPHEPFFIPDLILFGATVLGFQRAVRVLGVGPLAATVSFLLGDLILHRTAKLWLEPWTTTLSAALLWWLIALAIDMVAVSPSDDGATRKPPASAALFAFGAIAGALPLARPTDAIAAVVASGFAVVALFGRRRMTMRGVAAMMLGGLSVVLPYLVLHLAIYGPKPTQYEHEMAGQGFAFSDLPWKIAVVVISPRPWFPHTLSLIEGMPWIVPGLAGLIAAAILAGKPARGALALIACVAIPYCTLFLAFTDLHPTGLWPMHNAHYFKWLFPLLTAGCWLWIKACATRRGAAVAIGALAFVATPAFVRPLPVAVGNDTPARMLLFAGSPNRPYDAAYFAPATITDSAGTLANVIHFHQIPDRTGERAIAVTRLFDGPAVRRDPGEPPAYAGPQSPYARYAVKLSVGLPCWLGASVCALPAADH